MQVFGLDLLFDHSQNSQRCAIRSVRVKRFTFSWAYWFSKLSHHWQTLLSVFPYHHHTPSVYQVLYHQEYNYQWPGSAYHHAFVSRRRLKWILYLDMFVLSLIRSHQLLLIWKDIHIWIDYLISGNCRYHVKEFLPYFYVFLQSDK